MRSVALALAWFVLAKAVPSEVPLRRLLLALRHDAATLGRRHTLHNQVPLGARQMEPAMTLSTGERTIRNDGEHVPRHITSRLPTRFVRPMVLAAAFATSLSATQKAVAIGAQDIGLKVTNYKEIACPPELQGGRIGGALGAGAGGQGGIAQKCVEVEADISNDRKETTKDAAVYGNVYEKSTGMSVMGNGQDGKNDAGQLAMIKEAPPGESKTSFILVTQQADDCRPTRQKVDGKLVVTTCPLEGTAPLVELKFERMKAVAYPGGDRYKPYDECEANPFMEGCP